MDSNTKSDFIDYDIKKIFIEIPREELLKKNINKNRIMFKNKCIEEVKKFNTLKLNKLLSANKLIGVQEINSYLKGSIYIRSMQRTNKYKDKAIRKETKYLGSRSHEELE